MKLLNIDRAGLYQDSFSELQEIFGSSGQLKVVGFLNKLYSTKLYIVECSICKQDAELFGENAIFEITKTELSRGSHPCGCAKNPRWEDWQMRVLCNRAAKKIGCSFVDFAGEYSGAKTKITLYCEKHGEWSTSNINSLVSSMKGCVYCTATKSDEVMVKSFTATGRFSEGTRFCRSDRKDSRGRIAYWHVFCPDCGSQGESTSGSLQAGKRPCGCSKHNATEGYINIIYDLDMEVAIKFGVTGKANTKDRVKRQNSNSIYSVVNHSIYAFPSKEDCLSAEKACKRTLDCGILDRTTFKDGFTETTFTYNIDKIIKIYTDCGGIDVTN